VDDEQHFAPRRHVFHDRRKLLAVDQGSMRLGQIAHHFERADTVLARDLLEHAVGIRSQPRGERRALIDLF
jgi:hypothetical protein